MNNSTFEQDNLFKKEMPYPLSNSDWECISSHIKREVLSNSASVKIKNKVQLSLPKSKKIFATMIAASVAFLILLSVYFSNYYLPNFKQKNLSVQYETEENLNETFQQLNDDEINFLVEQNEYLLLGNEDEYIKL